MFSSSIIPKAFVVLLCFLKGLRCQGPPDLRLDSISGGCLIHGESKILAEGTADFTGRDSIATWSNSVSFVTPSASICPITLNVCPSSEETCYCVNVVNQDYRIVMNRTANRELIGRNLSIFASTLVVEERSDPLLYPQVFDPVQETIQLVDSSPFDTASGILPDDVTYIYYAVTGLEEPYNIMYNISQPTDYTLLANTANFTANFSTSQRILTFGYEEQGPTCTRQITHTLCRKGGIVETVMIDGVLADSNNIFPTGAINLNYTLTAIFAPFTVVVNMTFDDDSHNIMTHDNLNNIVVSINGSKEICITYEETGSDRLSQCLALGVTCVQRDSNTESDCSCDCTDWKEAYTIVLFVAMVIKLLSGILVLLLYCLRASLPKWPVFTLGLCIVMVATAFVDITVMCYQEISDCGLCDCQYAFILVEMIVTVAVIFFVIILLYKEAGDYFKEKWFHTLLLFVAIAMAAVSLIGIIVVFCNKEIEGSGPDSWHVIYLLIGLAMAAIVLIGLIALFVCQGSQVRDGDSSRNGQKPTKLANNEHELESKDQLDGHTNIAYGEDSTGKTNQANGDHDDTDNQSPRRLPPLQDKQGFNSLPASSISSQEANQDTTEVRKLKKKKKKRKGESENGQLVQDSLDSKESTDVNSPRRHSNSKIYPEESVGQPPASRPLPSPRQPLPPLNNVS